MPELSDLAQKTLEILLINAIAEELDEPIEDLEEFAKWMIGLNELSQLLLGKTTWQIIEDYDLGTDYEIDRLESLCHRAGIPTE